MGDATPMRRQVPKVDLNKLPTPRSVEAEEWVLGALLIDAKALDTVAAILEPSDFTSAVRSVIYTAILELGRRQVVPDLLTVMDELVALDRLVEIGGASFLAELQERCPTAANVAFHARIVKQHAIRREVIRLGADIATNAAHDGRPLPDYLPELVAPLLSMPLAAVEQQPLSQVVVEVVSSIEALQEHRMKPALSTGSTALDDVLGGWFPGFNVVAARTSVGKSSYCLSTALAAARAGERVVYVSRGWPRERVVKRALAQLAGVSMKDMLRGTLMPTDLPKVTEAADRLSKLPLTIHEDWQRLWPSVQVQIRRAVAGEGSKLIVVDYLGLLRMPDAKGRSRERRDVIGEISHDCKALANFLNVPMIFPVQINREVGKEKDHRPKLWHLRDSGDIEQDAGVVVLLHRPVLYDSHAPRELCEAIVAKQSNGPLATKNLRFNPEPMSFTDWVGPEPEQDQFRYEGGA